MAKLDLYIFSDNGQTRTQIGNLKGNDIVFHNKDLNAELKIDFSIEMEDKTGPSKSIKVPARGAETVKFKAAHKAGTTVKYTATIARAKPEDPIIIID